MITAAPTAVAGTAVATCSNSGAVNITAGASATNQSGVTWSTSNGTGAFTNATSLTTATYTPSAADITAGSVTLTLTAAGNGTCADATSTKTLTINSGLTGYTYSKTPVSNCGGGSDGSITVNPTGGAAPYQFSVDGGTFTSGNTLSGLAVGEHIITVLDDAGCTFTMPDITVLTAAPLSVGLLNKTNPSNCGGGSDGSITAFRIGGVFDGTTIQYSLTGPVNRPLQTSNVFSNLPAGSYTVTVTDSKGCTGTYSTALTTAPAVNLALAYKTNASSCGVGSDGSISC
jgi:hypothetical protein